MSPLRRDDGHEHGHPGETGAAAHSHGVDRRAVQRRALWLALAANGGFLVAEVVGGLVYVPARSLVRRFADLAAVPRDAIPGRGPGRLHTRAGPLGVLISHEVFFPDRARAAVGAGAEVLLVPTNASSYRGRQVPAMELAAARLRALETGRSVVQAAPTGYSAIVSASGRVLRRSPLGPPAVLQEVVARRQGATVYTRVGDAPALLLALLGLMGGWAMQLYSVAA